MPDSRPNCGGILGTATWGQSYWGGHIQCGEPPPPDTRTNCGGIWATATWGQAYWGSHIQCPEPAPPTPSTRTWCGGIWATATWAQMYWGGHIQCPEPAPPIPPVPPVPPLPPGPGLGGIGFRGRRRHLQRTPIPRDIYRPFEPDDLTKKKPESLEDILKHGSINDQDEEDLMQILALWLSIK